MGLGTDTEHVLLYFRWEHMETSLPWNTEQLLVLCSVIAFARKTLEKSFNFRELWEQTDHSGTHEKRC